MLEQGDIYQKWDTNLRVFAGLVLYYDFEPGSADEGKYRVISTGLKLIWGPYVKCLCNLDQLADYIHQQFGGTTTVKGNQAAKQWQRNQPLVLLLCRPRSIANLHLIVQEYRVFYNKLMVLNLEGAPISESDSWAVAKQVTQVYDTEKAVYALQAQLEKRGSQADAIAKQLVEDCPFFKFSHDQFQLVLLDQRAGTAVEPIAQECARRLDEEQLAQMLHFKEAEIQAQELEEKKMELRRFRVIVVSGSGESTGRLREHRLVYRWLVCEQAQAGHQAINYKDNPIRVPNLAVLREIINEILQMAQRELYG